ncbi:glycosyltransferase family 39 protein, partial [Myxococcota bacterium]|nr:glycosyltransferase family 39 protein [Myxococcota bacterium]
YDTFANAPLQYWARGLVIAGFGPGLFGMRILSALAGVLTVLFTYRLTLGLAGRSAAFLSGLLLLSNYAFVYIHSGRTGELETGVTLLLVGLAMTFTRALYDERAGFWGHHLMLVALLAWKAPVLPVPILAEGAAFALLPAARARIGDWLRTGIWVLPLALVWHGVQAWRMQAYLPKVIEAVGAQAGGTSVADGIAGRFLWYLERAWFGCWPQIVLLPGAWLALRQGFREGRFLRADSLRIVGMFLVAVIIFYSAISKVGPWYWTHAYPFLAILIAVGMVELIRQGAESIAAPMAFAMGLAFLPFIAPPLFAFDPFQESAIRLAMPLHFSGLGPFSPLASIVLTALFLMGLTWVACQKSGAGPTWLSLGIVVVIVLSWVRVSGPLLDLRRLSPEHTLFVELIERRERGREPIFPIEVEPVHPWIAHYYFGHDYHMQSAPLRPGDPGPPFQRFRLVGPRSGVNLRNPMPAVPTPPAR